MKTTVLVVAMVLAACGSAEVEPLTVVIDPRMPAACLEGAQAAVAWWQDRTELNVVVAESEVPGEREILVQYAPENLEANEWGHTHGRTRNGNTLHAHVFMRSCSAQVFAHEIGHALGLDHVNDYSNLMYPVANEAWTLTDDQMEALSL